MFQRSRKGYIERQIEMLAEVLARILTGKESGRYEAALAEAADACKQMTGLTLATLAMLPDETLLNLFRMGGGPDPGRCLIAARLLDAQAQVYEAQSRAQAAGVSRHKALALLLEAGAHDERLRAEAYRREVEELVSRLEGYALPDDLRARLAAYRGLPPQDSMP